MRTLARIGLVAVVLALCGGALTASPARADVATGDPQYYLSGTYEAEFTSVLDGATVDGYQAAGMSPPAWVAGDLFNAAADAGRFPQLATVLGGLTLAAGGFDIGWKIGRTIDTKWLHLEGGPVTVSNVAVTNEYVCAAGGGSCNSLGALSATNPASVALVNGKDTYFSPTEGGGWTDCFGNTRHAIGGGVIADPVGFSGPGTGCEATIVNELKQEWNAVQAMNSGTLVPLSSGDCASFTSGALGGSYGNGTVTYSGGGCYVRVWRQRTMAEDLIQASPQTFTNQKVDQTTTMSPAPSGSMTVSQLATARGDVTGSPDTALPSYVDCMLNYNAWSCPSGPTATDGGAKTATGAPAAFALPQPLPTETYDQYADRLRSRGFLGTITYTDASTSANPNLRAKLITEIDVTPASGAGAVVGVYNVVTGAPVTWPSTPVLVDPSATTTITLVHIPDSYTPPTPATAPGPGSTSGCPCTVRAIDWTPLETLNFGSKFPFGFGSYVGGVLSAINVTPVAPSWTFTLPDFTNQPWSHGSTLAIDFGNIAGVNTDTYMGWFRTLEAWLLWLTTIFILGRRLIFGKHAEVTDAEPDGIE